MLHSCKRWLGCLALFLWFSAAAAYPAPQHSFLLLDAAQMAAYKAAYTKGNTAEVQQVKTLLSDADKALGRGPYTITSKTKLPPSGDKHDFISQAPYFWPDPSKPDGKPYSNKDGLVNPESTEMKDQEALANVCKDAKTLGLAYYFSGNEKYAAHATKLLRTFFLDPATRMNPDLNYGQGIPGTTEGRSYGIIATRNLTEIPDAVALLGGSKGVDEKLVSGLKAWFKDYNTWLLTSKLGVEEGNNTNNHGTFYDVQVVDFALFTGDKALAKKTIEMRTIPRIALQLAPDGSQPLELERTRPWNYTTMNLQGWVRLAVLAKKVDIDLWNYTTSDGLSLHKAVAWFQPYLLRQKQMEHQDVAPTSNTTILALYNRASREYADLEVNKVFALNSGIARVPWAI